MFYESVKWRGSEFGMLYESENDETAVKRSMEHFPHFELHIQGLILKRAVF